MYKLNMALCTLCMNATSVQAELSHHSCGFLFGVLHDDGNLLFDITDKLVSDARMCVQNCATNVDAGKDEIHTCYTPDYHNIIFSK